MFTYCLFCETVKCGFVAAEAERILHCRAIRPKQVQHIWKKVDGIGRYVDIEHDLLPGYIFLYASEELEVRSMKALQGVIRILETEPGVYALSGPDEQFALMLYQKDGVIGKTKVYQEGERIRIVDGTYQGLETEILKVNKRNMRMLIEIPFANMQVKTWVEYEMVASLSKS